MKQRHISLLPGVLLVLISAITKSLAQSIDEVIAGSIENIDELGTYNIVQTGNLRYTKAITPSLAQSIDEVIAGSIENIDELGMLADVDGNVMRRELDMMLTKEQWNALEVLDKMESKKDNIANPRTARKRRKAIKSLSYRWTNKVIPYSINTNVFSRNDVGIINQALDEWREYTCIQFREANSNDDNKIYFDNGKGCYSYVGMTRSGSQKIGLAPGCRFKGVIVHEIGHAVGFHHEQNRPDRDNHVRIIKENIPTNLYYNFKKYPTSAVDTMSVPYDYTSVMHYGGRAFTTNGKYTIQTIDPKDQAKIGNRKGLSFFDIMLANKMYQCSENCDQNKRCPRGAFLGKDCQCWCPGYPVTKCASTGTMPTTTGGPTKPTTPVSCKDNNKNCPGWAKAGYCNRNTYVKTYCKSSCGFCSGGTPTTVAYCKDQSTACPFWGTRGYCKGQFEVFMSEICPKTCKQCDSRDEGKGDDNGATGVVSTSLAAVLSYSVLVFGRYLF